MTDDITDDMTPWNRGVVRRGVGSCAQGVTTFPDGTKYEGDYKLGVRSGQVGHEMPAARTLSRLEAAIRNYSPSQAFSCVETCVGPDRPRRREEESSRNGDGGREEVANVGSFAFLFVRGRGI